MDESISNQYLTVNFNYRQVTSSRRTDSMNTLSMLSSVELFIEVEQVGAFVKDDRYLWTMNT